MSSGIQACYRSSLTTGWFYFWQHWRESASYFFVLPTQKASIECSFPLVNIKKRKKKSPKIPWVWKLISRAASSLGRNYCPTANTAVKFHLAGMQTAAFSVTSQPNCPERSSGPVRTALRSAWHKPFPELPFSHHLLPPKMHFSKNHSKMYSSKGLARIREQWLGKVLAGQSVGWQVPAEGWDFTCQLRQFCCSLKRKASHLQSSKAHHSCLHTSLSSLISSLLFHGSLLWIKSTW